MKDVAILNFKPLKNTYHFVSANGLVGFGTHEAKTAADSITWEVIARKLADLHESLQLIDFYVNCKQKSEYIVGGWVPCSLILLLQSDAQSRLMCAN